MKWITPIFDRTQADVAFAIDKIKEWKITGETNTSDLKGCFNVSDINRIENDILFLSNNLSDLYYFSHIESNSWDRDGLPTVKDIARIIENVRIIIASYFQFDSAPELPTTLLNITQVNNLEENLHLIKVILDNMVDSFRECDTFYCGEE